MHTHIHTRMYMSGNILFFIYFCMFDNFHNKNWEKVCCFFQKISHHPFLSPCSDLHLLVGNDSAAGFSDFLWLHFAAQPMHSSHRPLQKQGFLWPVSVWPLTKFQTPLPAFLVLSIQPHPPVPPYFPRTHGLVFPPWGTLHQMCPQQPPLISTSAFDSHQVLFPRSFSVFSTWIVNIQKEYRLLLGCKFSISISNKITS